MLMQVTLFDAGHPMLLRVE